MCSSLGNTVSVLPAHLPGILFIGLRPHGPLNVELNLGFVLIEHKYNFLSENRNVNG